ncbi:MAG: hypothetical protein NZ473_05335 [Candidatus Kapabacteria bacterium]|nr:hypothetical protein [Candidatus Kapabacteria bacterium]MDW8225504.1 hypothetical protein [Bacteroidota bacterium]
MVKPRQSRSVRAGFLHYALFVVLFLGTTWIFQAFLLPRIVEYFFITQFKPATGKPLVNFRGVYASPSAEGEKFAGTEVRKEYINREYIFDFTDKPRNEKEHGYTKAASEWLARAPKLGEDPIILEPFGFIILSLDIGFLIAVLLTLILPPSIGLMSAKVEEAIEETKAKIRIQTGFSEEVINTLVLRDEELAKLDWRELSQVFRYVWERTMPEEQAASRRYPVRFEEAFTPDMDPTRFRREVLDNRIREHFSDFVAREIIDTRAAQDWQQNRLRLVKALRLYMSHHFAEQYSNAVTGLAYGGAALLIIAIGIRGLKFIPATRPTLILFAIFLEFSMLTLLAFTLFYTEAEERVDKMLKKMEDAARGQLETLEQQSRDIHRLAEALEGGTTELIRRRVEQAITEYLTSDDSVRRMVAEEISQKILIGIREVVEAKTNESKS